MESFNKESVNGWPYLPASLMTSHSLYAVTDVSSLGLAMTVFPAAIAGAILNDNR